MLEKNLDTLILTAFLILTTVSTAGEIQNDSIVF